MNYEKERKVRNIIGAILITLCILWVFWGINTGYIN